MGSLSTYQRNISFKLTSWTTTPTKHKWEYWEACNSSRYVRGRKSGLTPTVMQASGGLMLIREAQKVPAVFMFGDSYGDTGNNDYIPTIIKSNFPPYGRDFKSHIPTGRFSNGKLMPDCFVQGLGIKEFLPAYLDPTLQAHDLLTGVCFGSSGTGLDNLTAQFWNVIPVSKQIEYFKSYIKRIEALVGEERATALLKEAILFITIGTNDFLINYYLLPSRSLQFTIQQYTGFLLDLYTNYIKDLYNLNIRRIALINVPPLGCLPFERTTEFIRYKGDCAKDRNEAASGFNSGLNDRIPSLKSALPELRIITLDYNNLISEYIENPSKYGFQVVNRGCCGTGLVEVGILCKFTPFTCRDASKYVFFDSIHLSQTAYKMISDVFLTRDIPQLLEEG